MEDYINSIVNKRDAGTSGTELLTILETLHNDGKINDYANGLDLDPPAVAVKVSPDDEFVYIPLEQLGRKIFYLDVGDMPSEKVSEILNRIQTEFSTRIVSV